jgi:hypothetical protein
MKRSSLLDVFIIVTNSSGSIMHDPCMIRIYTIMIPTNANTYIEISLYTQ